MKKFLIPVFVAILLSLSVFSQTQPTLTSVPQTTLGLNLPTYGWLHYDDEGHLKSITGFNVALGYSARYFHAQDGLQPGRFNGYWGWGTIILILPYIEFGAAYPFEIAGGTQYVVVDFGLLYIFPRIGISIYF